MVKGDHDPFVSVIVPAFNSEATIKDLLESLMLLDYGKENLEIIIVDGGSTDRTVEIAKIYPVQIIVESRRGINVARNAGVKSSKGEILVFTDSDCVVPKDWVRKIVEDFRDQSVGCLGGSALRYEDNFLSRYADISVVPVLRRFRKREILDSVKLLLRYPAGCNMAFRREAMEKAGLFNEKIHYGFDEDDLAERVCKLGYKMLLDPEVIVWHKHRRSLLNLLKQFFNYGKGGALLIRTGVKGKFSEWILTSLLSFSAWITISIFLALLSTIFNKIFLIPFLLITVLPLFFLAVLYAIRSRGNIRRRIEVLAYPILDLLRLLSFNFGIVYGLLKFKV
ncbi:glycosyltransferase [Candidatus Bathyarchaeota archaeon]|nr:glycosyltransferase [Candidatus Bathyarchaeota archaeon]